MRLNVKAIALTSGLLWGILAMFLTGLVNLVWVGYGKNFLDVMASVYPGYNAAPSFGQVIVGTLYGFVDGVVGGAAFAWLYNRLTVSES